MKRMLASLLLLIASASALAGPTYRMTGSAGAYGAGEFELDEIQASGDTFDLLMTFAGGVNSGRAEPLRVTGRIGEWAVDTIGSVSGGGTKMYMSFGLGGLPTITDGWSFLYSSIAMTVWLDMNDPGFITPGGYINPDAYGSGYGHAYYHVISPPDHPTNACEYAACWIGIGIDNIELVSVPEPATLALLGLGVAGLIAARRKT